MCLKNLAGAPTRSRVQPPRYEFDGTRPQSLERSTGFVQEEYRTQFAMPWGHCRTSHITNKT